MFRFVVTTALLGFVSATIDGCTGNPNTLPFQVQPGGGGNLVKSVKNGKLYKTVGVVEPAVSVLHLYGTPYENGFAAGQLIGDQVAPMIKSFDILAEFMGSAINSTIPASWRPILKAKGVAGLLNKTFEVTKPYISQNFIQELQGLADGSGQEFDKLVQINMLPELIKAACSMVGAWGDAVPSESSLIQLRSLDFMTSGPFQQWPLVTVYHPNSDNGHAFATLGWSGFVGSITGVSSAEMGICEKDWARFSGEDSRSGIPFPFLLRDILQYDDTMAKALDRIENADRTCAIFVGVGDVKNTEADSGDLFALVEYSHPSAQVFDDMNFETTNAQHPDFKDVTYVDKHAQPSHDPCLGNLIKAAYPGEITAEFLLRNVTSQLQTGDMHLAVYDFAARKFYVSNASPSENPPMILAYDRPFIQFDLDDLWNEKPPQAGVHFDHGFLGVDFDALTHPVKENHANKIDHGFLGLDNIDFN